MTSDSRDPQGERPAGADRRRQLRVDVLGQVEAHSVWKIQPLSLREISLTGFSVEATSPLEVGAVSKFRLTVDGQNRSVVVQGRVRHCHHDTTKTGPIPVYVIGFEVIAPTESTIRELVAIVEYAKSMWMED